MARPQNADIVARKFQAWASSLPGEEQETLAAWMASMGGPEVQGYAADWYLGEDAWAEAWMEGW